MLFIPRATKLIANISYSISMNIHQMNDREADQFFARTRIIDRGHPPTERINFNMDPRSKVIVPNEQACENIGLDVGLIPDQLFVSRKMFK